MFFKEHFLSLIRMPSILTSTKQIPSDGAYFLAKDMAGGFTATTKFIYEPIKFTVGSYGVVMVQGTNVYFDTYANARSAITDPDTTGNVGTSLSDNELYRDMGKSISIYTQETKSTGGYYYLHVATLTKVQLGFTDGQQTEGVVGGPASAPLNRPYYYTGYVVTWSSNPTTSGIPVGVSRVGFQ